MNLVPVFNWGKGLIDERVQFVQEFKGSNISIGLSFPVSHRFKVTIGRRVQLVQGFNWSKGLIG